MSQAKPKNAYKQLIIIMIILLVLAALAFGAYLYLNKAGQDAKVNAVNEANRINQELADSYNQQVEEYNAAVQASQNNTKPTAAGTSGWEVVDWSDFPLTSTRDITVTRSELVTGGMLLVNRWHEIPADLPESELISVQSYTKKIPVSGSSVRLFKNAIDALVEMLTAAENDGLENFLVDEGYRDMATQTAYFDKAKARYEGKYTGDALISKTITDGGVNAPGTSEYQSGLSFRIYRWKKNDSEFSSARFETTPHSDWLVANSWKYGFVFRFPVAGFPNETVADKSYKTGEHKQLHIYRYVGTINAAVMHATDMCMEEYIEYLIVHPHIAVYEDGRLRYEILRVPGGNTAEDTTVQIAQGASASSISYDNMGGIIIAMSYD